MKNLKIFDLEKLKQKLILQNDVIEELKKSKRIKSERDIYGDGDPTFLFSLLIKKFGYLLDPEDMSSFTKEGIKKRKVFNAIVRRLGPSFLKTKQIIEDRKKLAGEYFDVEPLNIPDEPVIYVSNHGFRDDILGSILSAGRHAYVMFGSLPQFYNEIEGPLLFGNGVIIVNRKVKESRAASVDKSKSVIENGCSIIIFPEGVWNKSPNQLTLPLWRGAYEIAKQTGAKIVPIVHYIKDPTLTTPKEDNPFHTVVDNPIDVSEMSEKEALEAISEKFSTWHFLMMEKYGQTTREEALAGYESSQEAWDEQLRLRSKTADKYDFEMETKADYRPKEIVLPEDVFSSIADLELTRENAVEVLAARKIVRERKDNDFQRRF